MTNPDSAPSRKPARIIPFPVPKRLTWADWIISLLKTEPTRIFDAAERDEWFRKLQEEKSAPHTKPARKRARR